MDTLPPPSHPPLFACVSSHDPHVFKVSQRSAPSTPTLPPSPPPVTPSLVLAFLTPRDIEVLALPGTGAEATVTMATVVSLLKHATKKTERMNAHHHTPHRTIQKPARKRSLAAATKPCSVCQYPVAVRGPRKFWCRICQDRQDSGKVRTLTERDKDIVREARQIALDDLRARHQTCD